MSRISQFFLSLVIMSGFVMAQNTATNQTSDPGAAGQPSANQTDPSASGQSTSPAKKKHKKKKNQNGNGSADQSGNTSHGSPNGPATSQGTGMQPQDPGTAPSTPNDQTPQSSPPQPPPQTAPPPP